MHRKSTAGCALARAASNATQPKKHISTGFTLIELVVSLGLAVLVLSSAYLCLSGAVSSQNLIQPRSEITQSARVAMALITADLRSACPLSKDYDFLGMQREIGDTEADNLDFGTHNYSPRRAGEADFCQVSYFLDKDPRSGDFILWRRRNPMIAPDPLSGGSREEIASGLVGLTFAYYDGFDWYDEWGDPEGKKKNSSITAANLTGLPDAVRITMEFDSNPKASRKAGEPNEEPPLVFQTIVRLNLAAAVSQNAAAASPDHANPNGQDSDNNGGNQ